MPEGNPMAGCTILSEIMIIEMRHIGPDFGTVNGRPASTRRGLLGMKASEKFHMARQMVFLLYNFAYCQARSSRLPLVQGQENRCE